MYGYVIYAFENLRRCCWEKKVAGCFSTAEKEWHHDEGKFIGSDKKTSLWGGKHGCTRINIVEDSERATLKRTSARDTSVLIVVGDQSSPLLFQHQHHIIKIGRTISLLCLAYMRRIVF